MTRAALILSLLLMACSTPPACSGRLSEIRSEIAERERALARGYRVIPAQDGKTLLRFCGLPDVFCTKPVQQPRAARRVAVNPDAEALALARLRAEAADLRARGAVCS